MQRARTPSQQQHPHAMATTLTMAVAAVGQQAVAASSGGGEDGAFCLQDLLQELLMALVGYPGDVFVDSSSDHDRRAADNGGGMAAGAALALNARCHYPCACRLGGEILPPEACTLQLAPDLAWAGQGDRWGAAACCFRARRLPPCARAASSAAATQGAAGRAGAAGISLPAAAGVHSAGAGGGQPQEPVPPCAV